MNTFLPSIASFFSFGFPERDTLSDQDCMNILIGSLSQTVKGHYQDETGVFTEACQWDFVHCDTNGRIMQITTFKQILGKGKIELAYIPPLVADFWMQSSGYAWKAFEGTLPAPELPQNLKVFNISKNAFSGTIEVAKLPQSLIHFDVSQNTFSGSLDLGTLPAHLECFDMHMNRFSGTVLLNSLPRTLNALRLDGNTFVGNLVLERMYQKVETEKFENYSHLEFDVSSEVHPLPEPTASLSPPITKLQFASNQFFGGIRLRDLPDFIEYIFLQHNHFEGSIDLCDLPQKLIELNLSSNLFSGSIDICNLPSGLKRLNISKAKLFGSLNLQNLPNSLEFLWLNENSFSGEVDLTQLPSGMTYLHIGNNQLSGTVNLKILPQNLQYLSFNKNRFVGHFCLINAPLALCEVRAGKNQFSGMAVLAVGGDCAVDLRGNAITGVCSEDGGQHSADVWLSNNSEDVSAYTSCSWYKNFIRFCVRHPYRIHGVLMVIVLLCALL